MANANGNGNRLVYWLIGLVFPVLSGACAGAWHTVQLHAERLAVQESRTDQIARQLQRIEEKLDRMLESHPARAAGR